jgi:hypothetical protein
MLLVGVIAEEPDLTETHFYQDLRGCVVASGIDGQAQLFVGFNSIEAGFLERVCLDLVGEAYPPPLLTTKIKERTTASTDQIQCIIELFPAVAPVGSKNIAGEAF